MDGHTNHRLVLALKASCDSSRQVTSSAILSQLQPAAHAGDFADGQSERADNLSAKKRHAEAQHAVVYRAEDMGFEQIDVSSEILPLSKLPGAESGALSNDFINVAQVDPDFLALCRLWPSLTNDLRERIKGMIIEAVSSELVNSRTSS